MHVEFLVEDASSAAAIEVMINRLLTAKPDAKDHSWLIHPFDGKQRMLANLPKVLGGILRASFADRVVVLIDADRDDCLELKRTLQRMVLTSAERRQPPDAETPVWIRIAVTELETWFIGDPEATQTAYPMVTTSDLRLRHWQEPDAVPDAWEWLEQRLLRRGHYVTRMPKIEVARSIAEHLDLHPDHNRSRSFRLFLRTMREAFELS